MFGRRNKDARDGAPERKSVHWLTGIDKNDPKDIYNWKIYFLTGVASMGAFLYGYDSGVMGGLLALPSFQRSFGLDTMTTVERANQSANIVAMLQSGAFFGALGVGPFADRYGRKPCLLIGTIIFIIGSIMQVVAAPHVGVMMAGRAIGGFGVGACSTLAPLYTSENVPAAIRGRMTSCFQLFIQVGLMISFWINYGMSVNYPAVPGQWQVSLALQILPGVILLAGLYPLGESPRFLFQRGRDTEAIKNLTWTRNLPADHPYVAQEISDIQLQLQQSGLMERTQNNSYLSLWKEIVTVKSNRKRIALGLSLMVLQQMMGVNAINYYSPQIFQNLGLTGTSTSLFATGIYGVVKVLSSLTFTVFLADPLGRRASLIWTGTEQSLCLFYVGTYVYLAKPAAGQSVSPAGYFALVCIFLYIIGFEAGWGPVPWMYNSEIYTARLRGVCLGAAAATNWLFNFVVSRTTPLMLTSLGAGGFGTFYFYGSFCVLCALFGYFFCPETKGLSLEQMDALFGAPRVQDAEAQDTVEELSKKDEEQEEHVVGRN